MTARLRIRLQIVQTSSPCKAS